MKATHITLLASAALAVIAVGCGGSPASSSSSAAKATLASTATPASTAQVGQAFLSAAAPVDAAYKTWTADLTAAGGDPLPLTSQASAYVGVLTTFDSTIVGIGATGKAKTDITTLVTDDNTVIADLNSLSSQTSSTVSAWDTKGIADGLVAIAAGDVVRADLGLPAS
jgi:hypothetical protein